MGLKVIEYFSCNEQSRWLKEIQKSNWSAGQYLYELLQEHQLTELCGESTKVLMLADGEQLCVRRHVFAFGDRLDERRDTILAVTEVAVVFHQCLIERGAQFFEQGVLFRACDIALNGVDVVDGVCR